MSRSVAAAYLLAFFALSLANELVWPAVDQFIVPLPLGGVFEMVSGLVADRSWGDFATVQSPDELLQFVESLAI